MSQPRDIKGTSNHGTFPKIRIVTGVILILKKQITRSFIILYSLYLNLVLLYNFLCIFSLSPIPISVISLAFAQFCLFSLCYLIFLVSDNILILSLIFLFSLL